MPQLLLILTIIAALALIALLHTTVALVLVSMFAFVGVRYTVKLVSTLTARAVSKANTGDDARPRH